MKFLSYNYKGNVQVGVLKDNQKEVVPISNLISNSSINLCSMNNIIDFLDDEKIKEISKKLESVSGIALDEIKIVAPISRPKNDVICLGINYFEHGEESAKFHEDAFYKEKSVPIYFSKRVYKAVGHNEFIDGHFDIVDGSLDYEVELAVIIGKDAKNVKKEDVEKYIFGYTILNDTSARNLQIAHNQWYFGKSLDEFTSMGPYIVTKDEFDYPIGVDIRSYVNDELRQNSNTSMMITKIDEAIEELSKGMTLEKGTIIAMGTPAGVGMGFDPPKFLKKGDVVRCEIDGIGSLENEIK